MTDKKISKRLSGLSHILSSLQAGECYVAECKKYLETLTQELEKLLGRRNLTEEEGLLSTKILSIISLIIGPSENYFVEQFAGVLKQIITRSSHDELRISALQALGFISFVCSGSNDSDTWSFVEDVLCGRSEALATESSLQVEAAKVWCMLSSIMPVSEVFVLSRACIFEACADLLNDSSIDIRVKAGECLAVLWEAACSEDSNEFESSRSGQGSSSSAEESGQLLCSDEETLHQVLYRLRELSTDCSKKVSKKDRKEQVIVFRELISYIIVIGKIYPQNRLLEGCISSVRGLGRER
jgi:hypothetical protein